MMKMAIDKTRGLGGLVIDAAHSTLGNLGVISFAGENSLHTQHQQYTFNIQKYSNLNSMI
jgi:hypothetical protein